MPVSSDWTHRKDTGGGGQVEVTRESDTNGSVKYFACT